MLMGCCTYKGMKTRKIQVGTAVFVTCNLERNASSRVRDVKVKDVSFDPKNKNVFSMLPPFIFSLHLNIYLFKYYSSMFCYLKYYRTGGTFKSPPSWNVTYKHVKRKAYLY